MYQKNTVAVSKEFTPQEKRIIELCHEGLLAKEIADLLKISPRTVEAHKTNIFTKLGIIIIKTEDVTILW
jgi:DNA-binding NarL/FixJ family response regulator